MNFYKKNAFIENNTGDLCKGKIFITNKNTRIHIRTNNRKNRSNFLVVIIFNLWTNCSTARTLQ